MKDLNRQLMIKRSFCILFLVVFCSCNFENNKRTKKNEPITVEVWYGDVQDFGKIGLPQKRINILGNAKAKSGIASLSYSLNGKSAIPLTLGSDLHRLAGTGDFNVDIDRSLLHPGKNSLKFIAKDSSDNHFEKDIRINYIDTEKWPLPYSIRWKDVKQIQDVAQVVDGHWEITKSGLHNKDVFYDRIVAIGDDTWQDYEVSTTVTFHSFTPPALGPPTYEISHAAISSRFPGYDNDSLQPHRKWYPIGATSEFRLTANLDSCRWRIYDGPKPDLPQFYAEQPVSEYRSIELNKRYNMKNRVETLEGNSTRYSAKLWAFGEEEPQQWDLVGIENDENVHKGSALLVAHNTSVTFGDVYVSKIVQD
ncbi:hypothetical protein K8352_12775 [Flavobacteriaceae bacterium F89]|uniref:Uncharacterized protein n=1 Tax=Cerina litoralis TaxID=2874477 RepID=A0AAE3JTL8_9FLAO|nr:hypothetical protein [Cerina litoralis]MCG2461627.1 hypothetical protein [Cerina litoralis]